MVIPPGIGLGATHKPVHTHDEYSATGTIHMEFGGLVKKSDIQLGEFFKNWDIKTLGLSVQI